MKKILIITGIFPPDIGGPATFVNDLFSYIKSKKDKVKVITLQDKSEIKLKEENIIKIERGKNKILRTLQLIYKIRKNSKNIDTILCCGLMFETYLSQIGLRNKKIYRFVGDSIWDKYFSKRHESKFNGIKKSFFINLLTFFRNEILKSFDLIITPSNFLMKFYLENIDKGNIKVINNFTNLRIEDFSKSKDFIDLRNKKETNFITLSRLVKCKNINYLIEAFKDLSDCNLYIYGAGPEEEFYKYLIKKNHSRNIFMLGKKNRNEIIESLLKSDCFIQISSYEGMSFSVLEALSLNKPMILSNIEPNLETAKFAAIYVNPYSINQLKNTISLLKCNLIRKKIADNSKKINSQFYDREKSLSSYYNEL